MTGQEIRDLITARAEVRALIPNTKAIAQLLSTNRSKLVPTKIGINEILDTLDTVGIGGGAFIDFLVTAGSSNRNVFWAMELIKRDSLRIDMDYIRKSLQNLTNSVPAQAAAANALLTLGYSPDPISEYDVRLAIYSADGQLLVSK